MIVEPDTVVVGGSLRVYGFVGAVSALLGVALLACALLPAGGRTSNKINVAAGLALLAIGAGLWRLSHRDASRRGRA